DVEVEVVVGHHSAEIELLEHAEGKDLIVVGARSHGLLGEFFLQSVATHLVQRASCPVAVVPNRRR
ncbi:MAG TPA: universal stress protein, partial [Nocardioides sp.]|nr:universal stress protein [Nocardioides sp.]